MTYARINTITFVSEKAADNLQENYALTAVEGFPEAQLLVAVRTGPLTASLTSIYEAIRYPIMRPLINAIQVMA